jgi:hypothetical protein
MLSSATLMMAKFGDMPVFDLNPAITRSASAKEFAVVVDSSNLDLTSGVAQALVDSKKTNVQSQITGSVQEYSAENLLRAQGVATGARQPLRGKLKTAANGGAASLTISDNPIPGDAASSLGTAAAKIKARAHAAHPAPDDRRLRLPDRASADSTFAAGDHTVAIAAPFAIPDGMDFPAARSSGS